MRGFSPWSSEARALFKRVLAQYEVGSISSCEGILFWSLMGSGFGLLNKICMRQTSSMWAVRRTLQSLSWSAGVSSPC